VTLTMTARVANAATALKVAPTKRFPKPKQFGWWLVVGNKATGRLDAIKRIKVPASCVRVVALTHCVTSVL
jgi:hypothetical protein